MIGYIVEFVICVIMIPVMVMLGNRFAANILFYLVIANIGGLAVVGRKKTENGILKKVLMAIAVIVWIFSALGVIAVIGGNR